MAPSLYTLVPSLYDACTPILHELNFAILSSVTPELCPWDFPQGSFQAGTAEPFQVSPAKPVVYLNLN